MFESSNSKLKICNGFCLKSSPQSLNLGNKSNQTVLFSCCIWVCTMSQSIQHWSFGEEVLTTDKKVFLWHFFPRWHCKTSRERPPCWQRDLVWRLKRIKTWLSEFLLLILFLKLFVLPPRCATAEPDMKGKVVYEVDDPNRPRYQIFVSYSIIFVKFTTQAKFCAKLV